MFVIESKQCRGRLRLNACGRLRHGRCPLAPTLSAVSFEADRAARVLADPQVVMPFVAVHGAQVPWGKVVVDGVPVVPARRLPSMLRELPGSRWTPGWPATTVSAEVCSGQGIKTSFPRTWPDWLMR